MSKQMPPEDDHESDEVQESAAEEGETPLAVGSDDGNGSSVEAGEQFTQTLTPSARPRAKLAGWREHFILALQAKRGNVNKACVITNISRATAFAYRAKEQDFAAAWDEVVEGLIDSVEETVMESGMSGDPEHAQFILKTRRRPVYGDKVGIEITGAVAHLHLQPDQLAAAAANALPWIQEARAKHLKGPKPGAP